MLELPPEAGITEIAEYCGVSRDRAKRVLDLAGVKRDKYRKFKTELALQAIQAFLDTSKVAGNHLVGRGNVDAQNNNLEALAAARQQIELVRLEKMRLDVEKRSGKLLDKDETLRAVRDFSAHVRSSLLGFPQKVCADLVGIQDASEIARILSDRMHDELVEVSDAAAFFDKEVFGA
ncbi:hypothetical protein [Methylocystis parvus]|uniref:hypothetical protein n=1 Tax=Methylocystis parvus TaxID=134 RepID=UPI003C7859F5